MCIVSQIIYNINFPKKFPFFELQSHLKLRTEDLRCHIHPLTVVGCGQKIPTIGHIMRIKTVRFGSHEQVSGFRVAEDKTGLP